MTQENLDETIQRNHRYSEEQRLNNFEVDNELIEKKQKHEEIKQKAWGLFEKYLTGNVKLIVNKKKITRTKDFIKFSWCRAEEFYNFAKAKEREEGKNETEDKTKCVQCGVMMDGGVFPTGMVTKKGAFCSKECYDQQKI